MRIDFSPSERTSLGGQWQLDLIDRDTHELSAVAASLLAQMRGWIDL